MADIHQVQAEAYRHHLEKLLPQNHSEAALETGELPHEIQKAGLVEISVWDPSALVHNENLQTAELDVP